MINIPEIYDLPKTHKPHIPFRPINSGITTLLPKIWSLFLGTISDAHINDSGSYLNKIININMKNKSLASLDIKFLHTNVLIDKWIERLENHLGKTDTILPLPGSKLIEIFSWCMTHTHNHVYTYTYK